MSAWAKLAADIHRHPKVRKGGRNAREVFVFVLAVNADQGASGHVPAAFVDPWYLADALQCSEADAREGLQRAQEVKLLQLTDDGDAIIVGWDAEEWGRGERSMTEAERKRLQRQEKRKYGAKSGHDTVDVSTRPECLDTSGMSGPGDREEIERRGDREETKTPIPPKGGLKSGRSKSKPDYSPAEVASAERILAKITERTGVGYQGSRAHLKLIVGRLRDGVDELDLRAVIAYCWDALDWRSKSIGDTPMSEYLKPETLFGPQTVNKYLPSARKYRAEIEGKRNATPPRQPMLPEAGGVS